jgi:hypothetical protein
MIFEGTKEAKNNTFAEWNSFQMLRKVFLKNLNNFVKMLTFCKSFLWGIVCLKIRIYVRK